ncbi:MAG TPA: TolC family protein [Ramlibacter sp.]|uniref:TolC family protein n=1 Tax=Ramlibacter sp. TaxID=1917967 RepID=UPI002BA87EC6|nr:TolC family protein [Ramlibacter sp.]HVZ43519.1 TolC family protein [Ramlibacter sp.]
MKRIRVAGVLVAGNMLAGCAQFWPAPPTPVAAEDIAAQTRADAEAVRRDVQPLAQTLTLDEAIARALKYNLDRRSRLMEEALNARQFEAGKYDMLPRIVAQAGYFTRDSDRLAIAADVNGVPTGASPTVSQERTHYTTGLEFTWSLLDFGIARYTTQQTGDRVLAAAERRRKVTHQLVQDVSVAFWRAVSAQRLQADVKANLVLAEEAMGDARKAEAERIRSPLDSLRFQRQLTENMRLLEAIEQELATARFELAGLINAPVVMNTTLVAQQEMPVGDLMSVPVEQLEEVALAHNADLREQMYNRRIAVTEAKKVIARAYPNISLDLGAKYDSDRYLVHHDWAEAGLQVSYNLLNLLALPAQKQAAEAGIALADQRRLAMHVATVTQVHVAREQLIGARKQFQLADQLWVLDDRITKQMASREQAQAGSKLERVAAQTTAIVSLLRRYQALAQWHAAQSRMQATLGLDPLDRSTDDLTLGEVMEAVRLQMSRGLSLPAKQ